MENVHRISIKQHGDVKWSIWRTKNWTISQVVCAGALSC